MPFFIIFVVFPLIEISIFMAVGDEIGLLNTLILALLTAIIGGGIVKYQGIQTFLEGRQALGSGQMPVRNIFDGFCLIAAGALLITPGFFTDTIGFLLLVPALRARMYDHFKDRLNVKATSAHHPRSRQSIHDPDIIEGDYERLDEDSR